MEKIVLTEKRTMTANEHAVILDRLAERIAELKNSARWEGKMDERKTFIKDDPDFLQATKDNFDQAFILTVMIEKEINNLISALRQDDPTDLIR